MVYWYIFARFVCTRWLVWCGRVLFYGCYFLAGSEEQDSAEEEESNSGSEDDSDAKGAVAGGGRKGHVKTGEKSFPPPAGLKT